MQADSVVPSIRKGVYRHSKSGQGYRVLGVALATEDEAYLVIYTPLYESHWELFARPLEVFAAVVEIDGVQRPRFEFIPD